MIEIIMPQGGQDLEKGQVVRWLKDVGDPIQKGDVLCEVETEKAIFEVNSPADGYLRKIIVPAGQDAAILAPIGLVGDLSEPLESAASPAPAPVASLSHPAEAAASPVEREERGMIRISPKAKRVAEENNVPVSELRGTGPGGRILEKDVADYIAHRQQATPAAAPAGEKKAGGTLVTLDKLRRATAQRMLQSKQAIPHFYVTRLVDMTDALAFRQALNAASTSGVEVSINDLIVRACALALKDFPQLNASYQDEDHIMLWDDINISVAVSVGESLMAPVIEHADQLHIQDLAKKSRETIQAARNGRLLSLAAGRFTVSNMGMYGVDEFTAIINGPEAAILAVASVKKQLVVQNGLDLRIRDMMSMTLSIDHRVADGALGCQFVNKVKALLECPEDLR